MNETVDIGPIIRVNTFDFDYKTTAVQLLEKVTQDELAILFKEIVLEVREKREIETLKVDNSKVTYISKKERMI